MKPSQKEIKKMSKKRKQVAFGNKLIESLQSPTAEAIQCLQATIAHESKDKPIHTIAFTSAVKDEGKSGLVANLAYLYSLKGKKICIVDLDFRNPNLHTFYSLNNDLGVINFVDNNATLEEIVSNTNAGVDVICSGKCDVKLTSSILESNKISLLFDELNKKEYDLILINAAPCLNRCDAQVISNVVDKYIFVCSQLTSKQKECVQAIEQLEKNNLNILGSVITGAKDLR